MTVSVLRGNALEMPLADNSVDLICTSPPYFGLRSYQDGGAHYTGQLGSEPTPAEFVDALLAATREMVRVVKPSGSIWVNLGDKYAGAAAAPGDRTRMSNGTGSAFNSDPDRDRGGRVAGIRPKSLIGIPWRYALRCIDDLGLILRAEVIWSKPNGLPESVTDRVRRSHESWFHFVREPRYYSSVDEIREPHTWQASPGYNGHAARQVLGQPSHQFANGVAGNPLGKLPGSVWTVPTQPLSVPAWLGVDHFAAFPMEWPRRIIAGWCPPGGMVLDPFMGTGTTLVVARVMGRRAVGVDLSADYCRLAAWRTTDPAQLAAAALVDKPVPQVVGQETLFEGFPA